MSCDNKTCRYAVLDSTDSDGTNYAHTASRAAISISSTAGYRPVVQYIGVASYGALGHVPPLVFQLVKILGEQIRKKYKNNAIFAQFLSIFGPFLSFFAHSFP